MRQETNSAPLVSVLMPVFNGEKYLRIAIESILAQTFVDFEFIIINDGSTDSTHEIILSYKDSRIRYILNDTNFKLIATLNKGLDLCRGKYIARMDADDYSYPNRLESQLKFMEFHPEYGLCGSDIEIMGRTKSWIVIGDDELIRFCFQFYNPICHPAAFIRTSVLRDNKLYYPAEYVHAEEYALWRSVLKYSKTVNLSEKLVRYRLHEGQISRVFRNEQQDIVNKIRLELFDDFILFSTPGIKKAHIVISDIASKVIEKSGFEDLTFSFGGWASAFQLRSWIFAMRLTLLFCRKRDNKYMRFLIDRVQQGLRLKLAEGPR